MFCYMIHTWYKKQEYDLLVMEVYTNEDNSICYAGNVEFA